MKQDAMTDRNVKILEWLDICCNMLFIVPVIMPYYRDQIGLSFQDFLIGEAVFASIVVALEVPSGWLSDVWRRKYVLAFSFVFWVLGFVVLLLANNLFMSVLAQGILGVGVSLKSGTDSALLYDTLIEQEKTDLYSKIQGRVKGYGLYMVAGASFVGGFLYELNPYLPLVLTALAGVLGLVLTLYIQEPERHKSAIQNHPVADMLATVRYALHGHAMVGMIILSAAVLFSSTKLIMWSQQPYYMALDIPEALFGVLAAVGYGLGGLASHTNHLLEKLFSNVKAIMTGWLMAVIVCVASAYFMNEIGVALLMFGGTFIFGATFPRVTSAINKRVESDRRATILSTASLATEMLFVPLSLIMGWMSSAYGIQGALNHSGIYSPPLGA